MGNNIASIAIKVYFTKTNIPKSKAQFMLLVEINTGSLDRENGRTELSTPYLTQLYILIYLHF